MSFMLQPYLYDSCATNNGKRKKVQTYPQEKVRGALENNTDISSTGISE